MKPFLGHFKSFYSIENRGMKATWPFAKSFQKESTNVKLHFFRIFLGKKIVLVLPKPLKNCFWDFQSIIVKIDYNQSNNQYNFTRYKAMPSSNLLPCNLEAKQFHQVGGALGLWLGLGILQVLQQLITIAQPMMKKCQIRSEYNTNF